MDYIAGELPSSSNHGHAEVHVTQLHSMINDLFEVSGVQAGKLINVYRVGTLKNRPLDEAPRPKVNNLESNI